MKLYLLIFSAFALTAGSAIAADASQAPSPHSACKADVAALCPGIQRGGGRVSSCLKQNADKVSPACKDAIAHARERKAQSGPPPAQ
jgi:Cysteine rich repeat